MRIAKAAAVIGVATLAAACSSAGAAPIKVPATPVPAPMHLPAAAASVSAHLLHTSDLGSGWYVATKPAITVETTSLPAGATDGARSWLTATHRTQYNWQLDASVIERTYLFASSAAARHYVTSWVHASTTTSNATPVPVSSSPTGNRKSGFVLGKRAYTIEYFANASHADPLASASEVVRDAKRRATSGG